MLRDDDTFVVDIGPVWDGYEGDYGDTFVTGRDDAGARCARAAREVFRRARLDWLAGATGEALYDRADAYAREYGCALVREILATASRIFLTPCTASTSWRTPTSRPPTASGCWRSRCAT